MKKTLTISIFCFLLIISIKTKAYNFDSFWSRNYYTSESNAELYIVSSATGTASVVVKDASMNPVYQNNSITITTGYNKITVALGSIPIGEHTTTVTLTTSGTQTKSFKFFKKAPLVVGNEIKVDKFNRCILVNGVPFLPFGAAQLDDQLQYMNQEGYNTVLRWGEKYSAATSQAAANDPFLNSANTNGLKVVDRTTNTRQPSSFYGDPTDPNWQQNFNDWKNTDLPAILSETQKKPALIGQIGLDEPGIDSREYYAKQAVLTMQQLSPYQPAMSNYNHGGEINDTMCEFDDVISNYIYWRCEKERGRDMSRFVKKSGDFARDSNKPMWIMPMTELNYSFGYTPMTPEEQYANTYIMLVNGATGIYYFTWPNYHRATVQCFQALGPELQTISPALLRRQVESTISYQGGDDYNRAVDFTLRTMPDGSPVLIFVNTRDYSVDFSCTMPWLTGNTSLVSLVNRGTGMLNNGTFTESLEPLATRAYKINGFTIADVTTVHNLQIQETAVGSPHQYTNLITDPSFENQNYWTITGGANVTFDIANPHSGQKCVKFSRPSTGTGTLSIQSPVLNLLPNHTYEFGIWRKQNMSVFPTNIPSSGATVYLKQKSGPALAAFDLTEGGDKVNYDWKTSGALIFRTENSAITVQVEIVDLFNQGDFWVDDIYLIDRGTAVPVSTSINLTPNSSFELSRLNDWPDRWRLEYYLGWPNNQTFVGDNNSPFRMDTVNPYHKNYSLRVKGGFQMGEVPYVSSAPAARYDVGIPAQAGNTYTFSIYMRASAPNTPVTIDVKNIGNQTFNVGTSWARYSITGTKTNAWPQDYTGIEFEIDGTVWLDAVQIEQGSLTPYQDDNYVPEYPQLKPTAILNGPYTGIINTPVSFTSSGSKDSDGNIVSYLWNFGDFNSSTSANPSHSYSAAGTYTVTLTVTDNDGLVGTNTTTALISLSSSIDEASNSNSFTMYPNPSTDQVFTSYTGKEAAVMFITNMLGSVVQSNNITIGTNVINVSELSAGVYFVYVVSANSKSLKQKLIISK